MRATVLVVAKAPIVGHAKTRLRSVAGPGGAADVAAAALLDTLETCEESFPSGRRVFAVDGDLRDGLRVRELLARSAQWSVVPQRGAGLGERLVNAHTDAARLTGSPVLQLGMDTPQVTTALLRRAGDQLVTGRVHGVLGLAEDGGWWALGTRSPAVSVRGLRDIAMSRPTTGAQTLEMLRASVGSIGLLPVLRDVDEPADAEAVAAAAPNTRFAEAWRRVSMPTELSPAEAYGRALAGSACLVHGLPGGPEPLPVARWSRVADAADLSMIAECAGPTLDVGCGPGRLTRALSERGEVALGIDVVQQAVHQTNLRGAAAIRRDVFEPLPGEGRWEAVLLADGNIGIGGDPVRLLRRVEDLLAPQGRVLVEAAPPGTGVKTHRLRLEVDGCRSASFAWSSVSVDALAALAEQAALSVMAVHVCRGRWFARLARGVGSR